MLRFRFLVPPVAAALAVSAPAAAAGRPGPAPGSRRAVFTRPDGEWSGTKASEGIAVIGRDDHVEGREGISIYRTGPGTGYLIVSDQKRKAFRIDRCEGTAPDSHEHALLKSVAVSAIGSVGGQVTNAALAPEFPNGLFVAMSNGRVFHDYSWDDIAGSDLKKAPGGVTR